MAQAEITARRWRWSPTGQGPSKPWLSAPVLGAARGFRDQMKTAEVFLPEVAETPERVLRSPIVPGSGSHLRSWVQIATLLALWMDCVASRAESPTNAWWAFRPVQAVTAPAVSNSRWPQTPVDTFILSKIEAVGLRPTPRAEKRTLLRRVYFDLIGLPPTPDEGDAFMADASPEAFSRVVERLLASPRYGERWGRHWMDVVRYADTAGDNADYPVPEARLYRDYIIDAFNADKPYDQFVREQLAGDLLAREGVREQYAERVIATGFLALSRRYATAPFELMHLTVEDAIETTGRAFLGLTPRCARCHDHKFDPMTQQDYYGLYGLFASTRFPYAGSEEFQSKNLPRTGFIPLVPAEEAARPLEKNRLRVESLRTELVRLEQRIKEGKTNAESKKPLEDLFNSLRLELKRRERSGALPELPVAYAVADDQPIDQSLQQHGEPGEVGPVVPRCAPGFLTGGASLNIPPGSSGRREFAAWLTRPENPLTARVMVNRIWQHHFGKGLVATPSNFGLRGDLPSHPELLDWLASYFVQQGWSVKAMHRLLLASATWQQSSTPQDPEPRAAEGRVIDPSNRLCWHFDRRRLDAESIRDALLAVAGNLDLERPGEHPFPPVDEWHWTQHNPFKAVYDSNHRSVYLMRQRLQRHPYLALFDAPDTNTSTDQRTSATVPLQALYWMNNPFVREESERLASRILSQTGDERMRIAFASRLIWARPAAAEECDRAIVFLRRYRERAERLGTNAKNASLQAWASYGRALLTANEFLYID